MTRLRPPFLIELVNSLRKSIDARKAAQRAAGDSLSGEMTYSGNSYDFSTGAISGTGTIKKYLLTFTANSAPMPVILLFPYFSIDNSNVLANAVPPWANGTNIGMTILPLAPAGNVYQWAITLTNTDSAGTAHTAYLLFVFNGTDTGTWTIASY